MRKSTSNSDIIIAGISLLILTIVGGYFAVTMFLSAPPPLKQPDPAQRQQQRLASAAQQVELAAVPPPVTTPASPTASAISRIDIPLIPAPAAQTGRSTAIATPAAPRPAASTGPRSPSSPTPAIAELNIPDTPHLAATAQRRIAAQGRWQTPPPLEIQRRQHESPVIAFDLPRPVILANPRAPPPAGEDQTPSPATPEEGRGEGPSSHSGAGDPPVSSDHQRAAPAPARITILSGFEGSRPLHITRISDTHFSLRFDGSRTLNKFFLFRIEGAAGRTVRIDLANAPLTEWRSLNPVYSYITDLSDPASFAIGSPSPSPATPGRGEANLLPLPPGEGRGEGLPTEAHNGPRLPDTSAERWHFIPNVWNDGQSLSFVHTFEHDAFVAMRVPYTPSLNERLLADLERNPYAQVFTLGHSPEGRPLQIVKIGGGDEADRTRPCVFMYAREHGTEQDSSWVVEGALRFLISDAPEAHRLRDNVTFLLMPIMDPDGAAMSWYDRIDNSFNAVAGTSVEASQYADYFQRLVDDGLSLLLSVNLHNVTSSEGPHLFSPLTERPEARRLALAGYHHRVFDSLERAGFDVRRRPNQSAPATERLGGWLSYYYGALHATYEANSQTPNRHLSHAELRDIGRHLVLAAGAFVGCDEDGAQTRACVKSAMDRRDEWRTLRGQFATGDRGALVDELHWRRLWALRTALALPTDEAVKRFGDRENPEDLLAALEQHLRPEIEAMDWPHSSITLQLRPIEGVRYLLLSSSVSRVRGGRMYLGSEEVGIVSMKNGAVLQRSRVNRWEATIDMVPDGLPWSGAVSHLVTPQGQVLPTTDALWSVRARPAWELPPPVEMVIPTYEDVIFPSEPVRQGMVWDGVTRIGAEPKHTEKFIDENRYMVIGYARVSGIPCVIIEQQRRSGVEGRCIVRWQSTYYVDPQDGLSQWLTVRRTVTYENGLVLAASLSARRVGKSAATDNHVESSSSGYLE